MLHAQTICIRGPGEITGEVMSEPEVVVDVCRQRTRRCVLRVRLTVRFHFVGPALYECRCLRQVDNRLVELPRREVAVSAMPKHPRVRRVLRDAGREYTDGIAIASKVGHPPPHPDDRIGTPGILLECRLCRREVLLQGGGALGRNRWRQQRLPEERRRFGRARLLHDCA